jgi:hypothetical protein
MLQRDQRGFVLSGIALLLVLPAMLLSASFFVAVETGGEATSVQSLSDTVVYVAYDIRETIRAMKDAGMALDNYALHELTENYEMNTICVKVEIEIAPFDIWENIHTPEGESYAHYASGPCCEVKNLGPDTWLYNFEDLKVGVPDKDDDFNEPLLRLESLDNGDWEVTVENTYTAWYYADIWWGDQLIWADVNRVPGTNHGSLEPDEGLHVGESKIVTGVPSSALVSIVLEDPAGIVHYEENFTID